MSSKFELQFLQFRRKDKLNWGGACAPGSTVKT